MTTAVLYVRKLEREGLSMNWLRMATYVAGITMTSSPLHPYAFVSNLIAHVVAAIMTRIIRAGSSISIDWIIALIPVPATIFAEITWGLV